MRLFRLVIVLLLAIVVLPVGMVLAQEPNPTRVLPDTVEQGGTFNVTVNFTAPAAEFNSIYLCDVHPTGWSANVSAAWCQPSPVGAVARGNFIEVVWQGPYNNGTNFTVLYKVTVPCNASLGDYTFDGILNYYIAGELQAQVTAGDSQVEVIPPALCFSPASIDFYGAVNGTNLQNQTLQLWSSTPCMLNWSLSDDADYMGHDWLSENRTSGSCTNVPSSVTVSANTSGMDVGDYIANITIQSPDANNSPQNVTVRLYVRTTGTLKGQVSFSGRGNAPGSTWIEAFVVKFFVPGELGQALRTEVATTNETGVFTVDNVTAGLYDIGIKNNTCLSEVETNVTMTAGNVTWVNFGTIREGDCAPPHDDWVSFTDWQDLIGHAGQAYANADFNRNGFVDFADWQMLIGNADQKGDLYGK